eukprot:348503-Pelagomonas_calceolata.AAC.9
MTWMQSIELLNSAQKSTVLPLSPMGASNSNHSCSAHGGTAHEHVAQNAMQGQGYICLQLSPSTAAAAAAPCKYSTSGQYDPLQHSNTITVLVAQGWAGNRPGVAWAAACARCIAHRLLAAPPPASSRSR